MGRRCSDSLLRQNVNEIADENGLLTPAAADGHFFKTTQTPPYGTVFLFGNPDEDGSSECG